MWFFDVDWAFFVIPTLCHTQHFCVSARIFPGFFACHFFLLRNRIPTSPLQRSSAPLYVSGFVFPCSLFASVVVNIKVGPWNSPLTWSVVVAFAKRLLFFFPAPPMMKVQFWDSLRSFFVVSFRCADFRANFFPFF